jgi:hypothetical protein
MKVAKELYVKEEHAQYLAVCIRDRLLATTSDDGTGSVVIDDATKRSVNMPCLILAHF